MNNKQNGINMRIATIVNDFCGGTMSALAVIAGVSQPCVSRYLEGREPSLSFVQAILKKWPTISPDWLLFGTGDIYRNAPTREEQDPTVSLSDYVDQQDQLKRITSDLKDVQETCRKQLNIIESQQATISKLIVGS